MRTSADAAMLLPGHSVRVSSNQHVSPLFLPGAGGGSAMVSTLVRDQHPRRWSADRNIRIFAAMEGPTHSSDVDADARWTLVNKPRR